MTSAAVFSAAPANTTIFGPDGIVVRYDFVGQVQYRVEDQVNVSNADGSVTSFGSGLFGPLDLWPNNPSSLQPGAGVKLSFFSVGNAFADPGTLVLFGLGAGMIPLRRRLKRRV